jgi:hypothetical protein
MRSLFPLAVVALCLFALPGVVVFAADLLGYEAWVNGKLESNLGISHRVAVALPAAVILFLVPPIIVLLYFLRLRRKPVAVSSTFLWKKSVEDLHVNRLMQWLRRNILLLLQLLCAFVLVYAVLGPRLHGTVASGRHYILLIDHSASMSATDVPPDRLAWAKAEALKEIDAATDADVGMVIAFNSTAEIRQSYTSNRAALRKAVEGIEPSQTVTRIDEALTLAASLANPARSTENAAAAPENPEPGKERTYVNTEGMQADVHLYSDGRFPPVPDFALANLNLTYHTPPTSAPPGRSDNLAVVRFHAERDPDDPGTVTARCRVYNFRPEDAAVKVRLEVQFGDTTNAYEQSLRVSPYERPKADDPSGAAVPVEPGAEFAFTVPNVPENLDVLLHAKIEDAKDALPTDDEAWVVLGVVRKAKVLVFTRDDFLVRKFFDAPTMKKISEVAYLSPEAIADPKRYLGPAREGKYDLVLFDQCGPGSVDEMPSANTYFIGHPPPPFKPAGTNDPQAVIPVKAPQVQGWLGKDPLMRYLGALYEMEIVEAFKLPELPRRTPKLLEGERDTVLLAAIPRGPYTDLVQTFPLLTPDGKWNTTWPLKPSFPLFLRNVLFVLGNVRDASADESVRPGDVKLLRPGGVDKIRVTGPGVDRILERGTRADFAFADSNQVGVYTASWADQSRRFVVNLLDAEESDLAPQSSVKIGAEEVQADAPRKQPRELWKWVVLAGLLAVMLEWWVYNKRVQI